MTATDSASLANPDPRIGVEESGVPLDPLLSFPERHPALWILGSAVLGVLISQSSIISTAHAGVVILAILGLAMTSRRLPAIFAMLIYGGLCDVLWRATGARAPWESSKYLVIVVSILVTIRLVRHPRRLLTPFLMLGFLAPAAVASFFAQPFATAKDGVAFTLLGPIALATATILFRQFVVTRSEMRGLLWWAMSPCLSMAGIASWGTIKAGHIDFGTESIFATAGGFGPNQVSTVLGLGALFVIGAALLGGSGRAQLYAAIAGAALVAQALITLSRGGVYALGLAAMAMLIAGLFLSGNRGRGAVVLVLGGLLALVALNWAQGFSGGAVENRFNQDDSGRAKIEATELDLFREHPFTGVGAGQAKLKRAAVDAATADRASHSEFTRLLAEHGLSGAVVIALMAVMAVQAFGRGIEPASRALSVGFVIWSAATMAHSATRISAVGLVFGMASLRVDADGESTLRFLRKRQ